MKNTSPVVHLLIALCLMGLLWAVGAWSVKSGKLEWTIVALVAIVFAWVYAGAAWLQWIKLRANGK